MPASGGVTIAMIPQAPVMAPAQPLGAHFMSANEFRVERDSMGELRVPAEALWAHRRSAPCRIPDQWPRHAARLHPWPLAGEWAAAAANVELAKSTRCAVSRSRRPPSSGEGRHDAHFPVDVFQDRLGHQQQHECQRGESPGSPRSMRRHSVHRTTTSTAARAANDVIRSSFTSCALAVTSSCCRAKELSKRSPEGRRRREW